MAVYTHTESFGTIYFTGNWFKNELRTARKDSVSEIICCVASLNGEEVRKGGKERDQSENKEGQTEIIQM